MKLFQKFNKLNLAPVLVILLTFESTGLAKNLSKSVRLIYLSELEIGEVFIHRDGTVLNFPTKPEVHVGKDGSFDIAYVASDLIVTPRFANARTNLFIYVLGRRYNIKLISTHNREGDEIVSLRDKSEKNLEVEIR